MDLSFFVFDDFARQFLAVLGHKVARDHGAHAVTVKEVRKVWIKLADKRFELVLVLHHGMETLIAPVAPGVVFERSLAMTDVVIGCNDITGLHQPDN